MAIVKKIVASIPTTGGTLEFSTSDRKSVTLKIGSVEIAAQIADITEAMSVISGSDAIVDGLKTAFGLGEKTAPGGDILSNLTRKVVGTTESTTSMTSPFGKAFRNTTYDPTKK